MNIQRYLNIANDGFSAPWLIQLRFINAYLIPYFALRATHNPSEQIAILITEGPTNKNTLTSFSDGT